MCWELPSKFILMDMYFFNVDISLNMDISRNMDISLNMDSFLFRLTKYTPPRPKRACTYKLNDNSDYYSSKLITLVYPLYESYSDTNNNITPSSF
jgi:hypothetical protein